MGDNEVAAMVTRAIELRASITAQQEELTALLRAIDETLLTLREPNLARALSARVRATGVAKGKSGLRNDWRPAPGTGAFHVLAYVNARRGEPLTPAGIALALSGVMNHLAVIVAINRLAGVGLVKRLYRGVYTSATPEAP